MYRHYEGNSGRSRMVAEPEKTKGKYMGKTLAPLPQQAEKKKTAERSRPYEAPPSRPMGLSGELAKILGRQGSFKPETADLLLIAVLYLMYRESGDRELLIMMGALLFL